MAGEDEMRSGPESRQRRRREPATLDLTARTLAEEPVPGEEGTAPVAPPESAAEPTPGPTEPTPAEAPPGPTGEAGPQVHAAAAEPADETAAGEAAEPASPGAPSGGTAAGAAPEDLAGLPEGETAAPAEPVPDQEPGPAPPPIGSVPPTGPAEPVSPGARRPGIPAIAISALAGGIIGALLVGAGAWYMAPDLAGRLSAIEAEVSHRAPATAVQGLEQRVGAEEAALKALTGQVEALGKRAVASPKDVAAVSDRLGELDRRIGALESRPAPSGEAGASGPAPAPAAPPPPAPVVGARESAVLSVAMLVRDALSSGRPYARELDALRQAGADPAVVSALEPYARTGAPSGPAMASSFGPLREKLSAPPALPGGAGWVDRIEHGLNRVFRVRRTGEAPGSDPASIAARAGHELEQGRFAAALASLEALPEPQRGEASSFIDDVRRRLAAAQSVDVLLSQAVDRLLAVTSASGGSTP